MSQYDSDWMPRNDGADQPAHREIQIKDVIDPNEGELTFYALQDGKHDQAWITVDSQLAVSREAMR